MEEGRALRPNPDSRTRKLHVVGAPLFSKEWQFRQWKFVWGFSEPSGVELPLAYSQRGVQ